MPEYVDVTKAAELACCSIYHIREAIKKGDLAAYKPGKNYVMTLEDVNNWILKSKVKKQPDARDGK